MNEYGQKTSEDYDDEVAAKYSEEQIQEAKKKLNALVKELEEFTAAKEANIIDLALEFKLYVSLGDYGSGRHLCLDDGDWNGNSRGDWVSSSSTC